MHRTKLIEVLRSLGGQIFNVCWIKKNGTERCANARLSVYKKTKGGTSSAKPTNSYIVVYLMWNMQGNSFLAESGYRNLNLNTIRSINGITVYPEPIEDTIDITTTTKNISNNVVKMSA